MHTQVSDNGGEIKSLQDLPAYPREFVVRRLVVFVGIVIGCARLIWLPQLRMHAAAGHMSLHGKETLPHCSHEAGGLLLSPIVGVLGGPELNSSSLPHTPGDCKGGRQSLLEGRGMRNARVPLPWGDAELAHACEGRYACYYLTRNSLTYTAPVMVSDPSLNMDITQIGSLTSLFPIAYGFSKFVSGVLGARTSPTLMLAGGLMATAAVNLLFGAGNALPWFLTFWAINGILQARCPAWAPSAGSD